MLEKEMKVLDSFVDTYAMTASSTKEAWNRIKKDYMELAQQTNNKQSTPLCDKCQRNADNSCKVDVKCVYFIPME